MRHAAILGRLPDGSMKLVHFAPASEVRRRYKAASVAEKDFAGLTDVYLVPDVSVSRRKPLAPPPPASPALAKKGGK